MHILITGWFSYEDMGNTAGDMIARNMVCNWLDDANIPYDVAVSNPSLHPGGINLEEANPEKYTDLLFVCGPFGNGSPITELLIRFSRCRLIGVNLTLLEPLESWNPFTFLYERDSSAASNPDITLYAPNPKVPVVGVILITKQDEYGKRDVHQKANQAIEDLVRSREMSVVRIDTVLENNKGGLRTPGEIEALIARMDVVVTTRLHGTVLALKNGVPVIPIDPVAGGAKVTAQVKTLEWPFLFEGEHVSTAILQETFEYCLTKEARLKAAECAQKAIKRIEQIRHRLINDLLSSGKRNYALNSN
ncbi:MAG: polysaccharide pyruvyl transferase family protein [Bacteroidota bacterium]|nr:polysaccharide pyruvyl transferase family protein [Bacteroidota bacterium]